MNIIIPVAEADIKTLIENIPYIQRFLEHDKIIIISGKQSQKFIDAAQINNLQFINENEMINGLDFQTIRKELEKYNADKRTGWYFQQFLKLGYSLICEDEYYMSWDSDTIPIREIPMFFMGRPIFDLKTEYHQPYFETITTLFDMGKSIKESFISEHMVFKTEYVRQMISEIGNGKEWFLQIIRAIKPESISFSGFSEFETYGTYVTERYPDVYIKRKIKSIRNGKMIFGEIPDQNVLDWLSKDFDTISFEKVQRRKMNAKIYKKKAFRSIISPYIFVFVAKAFIKLKQ